MTYAKEPKLITDYLYFLPDDFQEISRIYRRPSGDVLIVVKNLYYLINFPSFNVKSGYNGQSIKNLGIPKGKRIDAIFRPYSRKTYTGCIMKNLWCYNFLIFYPILTNDTSNKIVLGTL
jgi:hypothetical protein